MSDGESREPRPAGGEVRVPITVPPRRPAEQPLDDAGSVPSGSPSRDPPPDLASEEEEQVPYPALAPTAFFCLKQTTRPRSWCLRLVCNPYPFPEGHRTPHHPHPTPGAPSRARSTSPGFCILVPRDAWSPGVPAVPSLHCPGSHSQEEDMGLHPLTARAGHVGVHHPLCVTPCPGEEHGEVSAVVWGSGMRCSGVTGMGTAPSCPLQNEEKSFNFASLPVRVGGREVYRRPRIYLRRGGEFQTGADPFAVYIRAWSACVLSRGRKMERVGVWGGHTHCS